MRSILCLLDCITAFTERIGQQACDIKSDIDALKSADNFLATSTGLIASVIDFCHGNLKLDLVQQACLIN